MSAVHRDPQADRVHLGRAGLGRGRRPGRRWRRGGGGLLRLWIGPGGRPRGSFGPGLPRLPACPGVAHLARRAAPGAAAIPAPRGNRLAAAGTPGLPRATRGPMGLLPVGLVERRYQGVAPDPHALRVVLEPGGPPLGHRGLAPALPTTANCRVDAVRPTRTASVVFDPAIPASDHERAPVRFEHRGHRPTVSLDSR